MARRWPQVRALCCQCGSVRMTTVAGHIVGEPLVEEEPDGRCLIRRKCAACCERTLHAYLRELPGEEWCRDSGELSPGERRERLRRAVLRDSGWDMGPAPEAPADLVVPTDRQTRRLQLLDEVERLRACQFRVSWTRKGWRDDEIGRLIQYLDDGVFSVQLNPAFDDDRHLRVLGQVWTAAMECSGVHWFVRSATPDDPDSVPYRAMLFVAVSHDARQ